MSLRIQKDKENSLGSLGQIMFPVEVGG